MNLAKHFGDSIRVHRSLLRISQEELADRAGIDRTYVSGIERGRRNPSLNTMQKLSDALGADLDVLLATARKLATEKGGDNR